MDWLGSLRLLAPFSLAMILAAALLDSGYALTSDYISAVATGAYAPLAMTGIAGLGVATAVTAFLLHRGLPSDNVRDAAVTNLSCAAILVPATLILPSQGDDAVGWRTGIHVGLATGAYLTVLAAAASIAWHQRQLRLPGSNMTAWAIVMASTVVLLAGAAGFVRFLGWDMDLRGLAQWLVVGIMVAWLYALGGMWVPTQRTPQQDI